MQAPMKYTYRVISPRNLRIHIIGKLKDRVSPSDIRAQLVELMSFYTPEELSGLAAQLDGKTQPEAIARVAIKTLLMRHGVQA